MHTAEELTASSFVITVDGRRAGLADVFPRFDDRDRLGVIVRQPCGGIGASGLVLATVTAFYDIQRRRSPEFFIYPDYFLFHVGDPRGDHGMLDIWPSHKEVVVSDEPEEILRAVNDRGVTRLLVEDVDPAGGAKFEHASLASAHARIVSCLAYSPTGRARDADVTVVGNNVTESYVSSVLERSAQVPAELRERLRTERAQLAERGAPVERYRRIGLDEALGMLEGRPALVG